MKAAIVLAILTAIPVVAEPLSPDEAKAKLTERDLQRKVDRDQTVVMTAGDLADLRLRIKQLEGEVSSLREQLGQKEPPKKTVVHNMIEIGMTKSEVLAFVNRSSSLKIIGISADSGVRKSADQVIVKREGTANRDTTVKKNEDDPSRTRTKTDSSSNSKTEVERVHNVGLHETIQIAKYGSYQQATGTHSRGLGLGSETDYETVKKIDGRITVNLVDGLVTGVNAN